MKTSPEYRKIWKKSYLVIGIFLISGHSFAQTLQCGGNSLAGKLNLILQHPTEGPMSDNNRYSLYLDRENPDGSIKIQNQLIAQNLNCQFSSPDFTKVTCTGGTRTDPEYFSVKKLQSTSENSTESLSSQFQILAESPEVCKLNQNGLDINSVFGNRPGTPLYVLDFSLSGDYACVLTP